MRAIVIPATGRPYLTELPDNDAEAAGEIGAKVEGWIEAVALSSRTVLWCNEEGKLSDLPINRVATLLARQARTIGHDYIAGNVVLTGKRGPDVTDVGDEWVQWVARQR